jgi:hypothetical protein
MTVPFLRNIFNLGALPLVWVFFVLFWLILNVLLVEGVKYLVSSKLSIAKLKKM